MCDCRFGISPVNYPDPDPEGARIKVSLMYLIGIYSVRHLKS